jgi:hypothetical protein
LSLVFEMDFKNGSLSWKRRFFEFPKEDLLSSCDGE